MTQIAEVAPDLYRISTFIPEANLQSNKFLVRDEQPLLFHTGMKGLFPAVRDAVAALLPYASIRWIGFSQSRGRRMRHPHGMADARACGNAVCSLVEKLVSVDSG